MFALGTGLCISLLKQRQWTVFQANVLAGVHVGRADSPLHERLVPDLVGSCSSKGILNTRYVRVCECAVFLLPAAGRFPRRGGVRVYQKTKSPVRQRKSKQLM